MLSIAAHPVAARLFALSLTARLPLAMLSIALLVHARELTGSFAVAGVVTGAYAAALGVGGPVLGRIADRCGHTPVVLASALAAAVLLAVVGAAALPGWLLIALASALGFVTPPVGASLRALLPAVIADERARRSAYAVEATASELTFIAGPPAALALGAVWSTGTALVLGGAVLLVASVGFALQRPAREWRAAEREGGGGSLRSGAMRTLVAVMTAVGVLFGAAEIGLIAAAETLDSSAAAAPLLALWGAGSLVGGMVAARLSGGDLTLLLVALMLGHLALATAVGSLVALGVVVFAAGAAIAPIYAAVYAMVDAAAPAGTVTEAFAWLATAVSVGAAVGAAAAGGVVEHTGPAAAFVLSAVAGALAVLIASGRGRSLRPAPAATR
jgi:predicted MFS family arabinose efflux permease